MQASVQTDRKKKPELAPIGIVGLPEVQEEDQRIKQRRIKKLTMINRELIQTLKRQNEQLTKKINKQKLKVGKSIERVDSSPKNLEREKKELNNAYKQIEMYKNVLKDLRAKQISTESIDKLNMLDNKIKCEDMNIQKLQKELKYVKNIKEQQEKELHVYENQDVKTSISELEEQLKGLKEKLKQAKKQNKKREQVGLKQHAYFIQLERLIRKQDGDYYPSGPQKSKRTTIGPSSNSQAQEEITQRQWQLVKAQLTQLKKAHEESNKKIQNLTRLRNKQIKACEDNELKIKEKQRKLQTVKTKLSELTKLVNNDHEDKLKRMIQAAQKGYGGENGPKFEQVYQNGKKVYRAKNPEDQRQVKRWMIPQGYMQQKGKVLPDSIFYSDKMELKNARKHKIIKIHVWMDSAGSPSVVQFFYKTEENKQIAGLLPLPLGDLQDLDDKLIEYKEGDYLSKIIGRFSQGILTSLTLISKFGKKQTFNPGAPGEQFKLECRPNEIPTCFFGAAMRDLKGAVRMCYLGCEFISDW